MKNRYISLLSLVLLFVFVYLTLPAKSDQIVKETVTSEKYITDLPVTGLVTTLNQQGDIYDAHGHLIGHVLSSPSITKSTTYVEGVVPHSLSDLLLASIEGRRLALVSQIEKGLAIGKVSQFQADSLKAQLTQINQSVALLASAGSLDFGEGLKLARRLDRLNVEVASATGFPPLGSLVIAGDGGNPAIAVAAVTPEAKVGANEVKTVVVKETEIKPDLYIVTLETRRTELEKLIAEGEGTGKLTQAQADDLRKELDFVTQSDLKARQLGAISFEQVAVIAARMDVLGQRLSEMLGVPVLLPLIQNGRFVVVGGQIIQLDEIAMRRAGLEGKISLELAHAHISQSQAEALRADLDAVADMEVHFRSEAPNGEFTDRQARKLFLAFDRVGSRLDADIASNGAKPVTGVY